jgi:hypothetical protein
VTAGTVEFTVNGMGVGRVPLNGDGVASTTPPISRVLTK